jgi:hypothetical protein
MPRTDQSQINLTPRIFASLVLCAVSVLVRPAVVSANHARQFLPVTDLRTMACVLSSRRREG